ncbi:MAG TPA: AAA family ATPase, partial [Streptosporangiaceae bacterium]|nr:AAA family ATPase [Streptosporangiaceae bacterium]
MLEEVRITGLGVIDDAVLEFSPGFTVVTGETGAGKTMVVTGLGLLFGGRADPARVRPGADRASVEGRLLVDPGGHVAQQVTEAGGELDDGESLLLTRSVSAEGRSRAHAGGRSVPVSLLTYLADDLVAVHGQADQQQLLKPGRQRQALDQFAGPGLAAVLVSYQRAYQRHREIRAELEELTGQARQRTEEADDLRRGLTEIEQAEPVAGEDTALLEEENRLAHADALHAAATTAHEALLGDPASGSYEAADAVSLLGQARQALEAVAEHDPALAALAARLSEAVYLVSDAGTELASYQQSVEADPARLAAVQERRAELTRLIRAYGMAGTAAAGTAGQGTEDAGTTDPGTAGPGGEPDLAGVLGWAERAARRLAELDGTDDQIGALAEEEARLAGEVRDLAGTLTGLRQQAADRFAADVTAELTALAMPHARLTVAVTPQEACGPHGADEVEIRLAAHAGAPALPLAKGASGGELSRVMLAIEVVFAG